MEAEGAKGSLEHAQESLENMAEVLAQVAQARAGVEAALEEFLKVCNPEAEVQQGQGRAAGEWCDPQNALVLAALVLAWPCRALGIDWGCPFPP